MLLSKATYKWGQRKQSKPTKEQFSFIFSPYHTIWAIKTWWIKYDSKHKTQKFQQTFPFQKHTFFWQLLYMSGLDSAEEILFVLTCVLILCQNSPCSNDKWKRALCWQRRRAAQWSERRKRSIMNQTLQRERLNIRWEEKHYHLQQRNQC